MSDAIAYMAWKRLVPWKILSMMAHPEQALVPVGFGSRNHDFPDKLTRGSRIWVVTRISNEFSLAGRVVVSDIFDRKQIPRQEWPKEISELLETWRFVAISDPGQSAFFEANNVTNVLDRQRIKFFQNRTIVYRDSSIEEEFQPCITQAQKGIFLSYRWSEGRRFAIALAREFRKAGLSPWLDALSITGYQAEREPGVNKTRLKKLIRLGIEKSKLAVVINTSSYAKTLWTKMELEHILSNEIPWFQVMRGGLEYKCDEPPLVGRKPELVVQEILKRCKLQL